MSEENFAEKKRGCITEVLCLYNKICYELHMASPMVQLDGWQTHFLNAVARYSILVEEEIIRKKQEKKESDNGTMGT